MPLLNLSNPRLLILAFLLPSVAWALHLIVSYSLAEWFCPSRPAGATLSAAERGSLFAISGITLLICVCGFVCCHKAFKNLRPLTGKMSFAITGSAMFNAFTTITIIVQSLPIILAPVC